LTPVKFAEPVVGDPVKACIIWLKLLQAMVNNLKAQKSLEVYAEPDDNLYPAGVQVTDDSNSKFKILTVDLPLSRSCGLQPSSAKSIKTTRQLSKIDPHVGGLEGGVTPTGFYSRPQVAAPALSNRGLGGDSPRIRFAKHNQLRIWNC
jgi:hypothetical protein